MMLLQQSESPICKRFQKQDHDII